MPSSKVIKPDTHIQDFPSDLDERIKAMEVRLSYDEPEAIRIQLRYEEIRTGGLSALNSHEIMYNGSGDPNLAINGQMMVLHSHVTSSTVVFPPFSMDGDADR